MKKPANQPESTHQEILLILISVKSRELEVDHLIEPYIVPQTKIISIMTHDSTVTLQESKKLRRAGTNYTCLTVIRTGEGEEDEHETLFEGSLRPTIASKVNHQGRKQMDRMPLADQKELQSALVT